MTARPAAHRLLPRSLRRAAVVTCVALTASLGVTAAATAADDSTKRKAQSEKAQADADVRSLTDDLHDTDAELSAAYQALQETQSRIPAAEAALRAAQDAEAVAIAEEQKARTALEVAQAKEERARDALAKTTEAIESSRDNVARFAAQIYQEQGGGLGELAIAMEATTPQEFADRLALVDTVMDVQHGQIGQLNTAKADQAAQEALLEALRIEKEEAQAQAQAALERAAAARAQADEAKRTLDNLAAQQQAQAANLETQKEATQVRLDSAQSEQQRLEGVLKEIARQEKLKAEREAKARAEREAKAKAEREAKAKRDSDARASRSNSGSSGGSGGSSSSGSSSSSFSLTSPCPSGCWVSSEFGMRMHPILGYSRLHAGRDYAGNTGTRVVAAASGTIISAGWTSGGGNTLMINHGIHGGVNLVTVYKHLNGFAVRGGSVSKGQVVGYIGTTGLSTGPHLHFETYEDGTPVDPRRWF